MTVTREEIRRIAALAELSVDDRTAAELEAQLRRVLAYVRQLEALDEGRQDGAVAPVAAADVAGVRLRPDVVGADPLVLPLHDVAPALREGLFVVPRLGEIGGGAPGA